MCLLGSRDHLKTASAIHMGCLYKNLMETFILQKAKGEKPKDEEPVAAHSRGPGWHLASSRESC